MTTQDHCFTIYIHVYGGLLSVTDMDVEAVVYEYMRGWTHRWGEWERTIHALLMAGI